MKIKSKDEFVTTISPFQIAQSVECESLVWKVLGSTPSYCHYLLLSEYLITDFIDLNLRGAVAQKKKIQTFFLNDFTFGLNWFAIFADIKQNISAENYFKTMNYKDTNDLRPFIVMYLCILVHTTKYLWSLKYVLT